jgi:DNA ligase-1
MPPTPADSSPAASSTLARGLQRRSLLLAWLPMRGSRWATATATAAVATWPAAARAASGLRMRAMPLAQEAPARPDPVGYWVSEKYDGVRALWDGGQLRFRSGLPVAAPAWFTERLPPVPLDGELWWRRGGFEALSAAVRRHRPDDAEWRALRYMVFELPDGPAQFSQRVLALRALAQHSAAQHADGPPWQAVPQAELPDAQALQRQLSAVLRAGGEGLMLRLASAAYDSGRSSALLKLKPVHDADALVLAHLPGRGRHAGRLGALLVQTTDGVRLRLGTGFSDAEREAPPAVGTVVSFSHRGVTEAGVPRFASFLRARPGGL